MANEQEGESLRVDCDGGKYTFIITKNHGAKALRYGEPWIANMYKVEGCNMTLALASDLDEARREKDRLLLALNVAVGVLAPQEPGDSRAVSDIFVALASIACGRDNPEAWGIVDAQARTQLEGFLEPQSQSFSASMWPDPATLVAGSFHQIRDGIGQTFLGQWSGADWDIGSSRPRLSHEAIQTIGLIYLRPHPDETKV